MVTKRLQTALAGLFIFQFLHGLAPPPDDALDEGGFTGLIGGVFFLLATMLAWYWVRRQDGRGTRLALALGIAIPVGFLLYHGVWFTSPVTNPYWGDGEASGWQWASLVPVMITGLLTAKLAADAQSAPSEEYRASTA